jgi:hypothetical protein
MFLDNNLFISEDKKHIDFRFVIEPLARNLEMLKVYITYKKFKMNMIVLNVKGHSENHSTINRLVGSKASVYALKDRLKNMQLNVSNQRPSLLR